MNYKILISILFLYFCHCTINHSFIRLLTVLVTQEVEESSNRRFGQCRVTGVNFYYNETPPLNHYGDANDFTSDNKLKPKQIN